MSRWTKAIAWTDPRRPVARGTFLAIAIITLVLDQASKWWAVRELVGRREPITVIPNYFALLYAENTGAAFSMFSEHTGWLALFSALISAGLAWWAWRLRPAEQGMRLAMGLILGGALGNLIDRVRLNYVVDFLHAHWQWEHHWPTFNIADSAVCIGIALMIIASFRLPQEQPAETSQPMPDAAGPRPPSSADPDPTVTRSRQPEA